MKKLIYLIVAIVALGLIVAGCCPVVPPAEQGVADDKAPEEKCATIQGGTIMAKDGVTVLTLGYDVYGYNYQAHIFNGRYCDYDRVTGGDYCDVTLVMKWSDTWLSNKDCNGDGKLDRGYDCDPIDANSSACEGAWCTNHQSGEYEKDGKTCKWTYFVKIVKAPGDAVAIDGVWYAADGTKIGEVIWSAYAIVQQVENDACASIYGAQYISPVGPGLGKF